MGSKAPNFLLIMADQLAAGALSAYGNPTVKAPNIDRIAEHGVVFENCYCNLPMCGPSRASMHCGILPFSIGMYDNASEFSSEIPTIAHYLRSLGYRAELSGKMHFVGPDQLHGYQKRHTTDIYPSNFAWTVDWTKGREYRPTNLTISAVAESGPCIRSMQMDYDDEVEFQGRQAIYDLARRRDRDPFLLTVSFTSPHSPFVIGQKYWDIYREDDIEPPAVAPLAEHEMDHLSRNLHYCQGRHEFTLADKHYCLARHGYYGMISYLDEKIGALVDTLRETGLDRNTIVILTADHGEMLGERGMWFKQHFFEWAARVPLIFYAPDRFAPNRVTQNVSLVDLMPTALDLAQGQDFGGYATEIDGCSLVGPLHGDSSNMKDLAISEFAADGSTGPSRMVKQGHWKLMWLEGRECLLYDLASDPHEISSRHGKPEAAAIQKRLEERLFRNWDPGQLTRKIAVSQQRRLAVHRITGGVPNYVHLTRLDDGCRYVRNAGAAETKARARLPLVASEPTAAE